MFTDEDVSKISSTFLPTFTRKKKKLIKHQIFIIQKNLRDVKYTIFSMLSIYVTYLRLNRSTMPLSVFAFIDMA